MIEFVLGEIAAFLSGFVSVKTLEQKLTLKSWFSFSLLLSMILLMILSLFLSAHPFAYQNLALVIIASLSFATITTMVAKWEINLKKNK